MAVGNHKDIGPLVQDVVKRLLANDNLVKLLYYTNTDPLNNPNLSEKEKIQKIFRNNILTVPHFQHPEDAQSRIAVMATKSFPSSSPEYKEIVLRIDVLVPLTQWEINDDNLRPYAILGAIQESLNNKSIQGLGRLRGGDFELDFLSDEQSSFKTFFTTENYD